MVNYDPKFSISVESVYYIHTYIHNGPSESLSALTMLGLIMTLEGRYSVVRMLKKYNTLINHFIVILTPLIPKRGCLISFTPPPSSDGF